MTTRNPKTIEIAGSWGTMDVDPVTGTVLRLRDEPETLEPGETGYRDIVRIDVDEWRRTYPAETFTCADILDVGYWTTDGRYEPPVADWRQECKQALGLR